MPDEAAMSSVYPVIGEAGFVRLVAAFYRQVPTDELLGPMYPPGELAAAEKRLRDFLVYRFGGPQRYIEERGHPRLRMRHAPFAISLVARDRWVELMDRAIMEARIPPPVVAIMQPFLAETATFMVNS
ncbi:MAG: globin [Planctomycetia bacterium]|nr:globin [Planctomycetia bacterium]